jgi:hypothetical protein
VLAAAMRKLDLVDCHISNERAAIEVVVADREVGCTGDLDLSMRIRGLTVLQECSSRPRLLQVWVSFLLVAHLDGFLQECTLVLLDDISDMAEDHISPCAANVRQLIRWRGRHEMKTSVT